MASSVCCFAKKALLHTYDLCISHCKICPAQNRVWNEDVTSRSELYNGIIRIFTKAIRSYAMCHSQCRPEGGHRGTVTAGPGPAGGCQ